MTTKKKAAAAAKDDSTDKPASQVARKTAGTEGLAKAEQGSTAKPDDASSPRKAAAKKAGANPFPEQKPADGEIVMATKSKRLGSPTFMAQYRANNPNSPDGAFFSDRNGSYSIFEGTVDYWAPMD